MNYEERLLYVARNIISYKEYGNDVLKASKVIRKYFKEKPIYECREDLERTIKTYQAGIVFVETHKDEFWKSKEGTTDALQKAKNEFIEKHPEIASALLKYMLLEIFNWYHER